MAKKDTNKVLKEFEEQYRTLTELMVEGVIIMNFEGEVLYSNESAAKMFGYEKPEEGIGKNIFNFITPESQKTVAEDVTRVYKGEWGFLGTYKVMTKDGNGFWVETLGRKIIYADKPAELVVLREITERKQMEEELKKAKEELEVKVAQRTAELSTALEKLQRILDETISALASAVEAKDPYTAGHQQRVAQLASAIAKEMGLPEAKINGIYMAAIIHDIGKIHVPAEILTKPYRLTDFEFNLIKTHPQFGYDILKTIEFPWPIAQAVFQHHEKIDGSGYPQGLSDKDIILEAKILGLADVVEAMATHRPYRAALGIDKALEEISEKKGILYDPEVVQVCIRLFTEKGFKFEQSL